MYKTLFIDDEPEILSTTVDYLTSIGFDAKGLPSADLAEIEAFAPEVVLLDRSLPGISGVDIVTRLRSHPRLSQVPIIMISGSVSEQDKLDAFDLGVDDYITKPFSLKELSARIRAVRRRAMPMAADSLCGFALDLTARKAVADGREIDLTMTEFNLLYELYTHPNAVLSRDYLGLKALQTQNVCDRTVDVHIASIRRKLITAGNSIKTVRGIGYKLVLA
jgi:DNA-binding response OmpR family regulator